MSSHGEVHQNLFTSRAHCTRPAGPIVNLLFMCTHGCFELELFVHLLGAKGSQVMPVLSTVEIQLSLHEHNITKESQKHGNAKKPSDNYELRAEVRIALVLHQGSVSHMQAYDSVDSKYQLECISPPVGRPTTCMVTRIYMYLVPACTSLAGYLDVLTSDLFPICGLCRNTVI